MRDVAGAFVMPGLVDVHNHHAVAGQEELFELRIPIGADLEGILAAVRAHAAALPADAWVVGGPWMSDRLGEISTAAALARLDEAAGGRPVILSDDSHHNRWASSRAMELGGAAAGQPGVVLDAEGRPTGVLLEAAGLPVAHAQQASGGLTAAQQREASRRGVEILSSFGVTAFQDAGVSTPVLEALRALDADGELDAWAVTSMLINDEIFGSAVIGDDLVFDGERYRTAHHRPDFVNIFLDGVPPTRTGAFIEPYLPDDVHGDHFRGSMLLDPEELVDWLRRTAQAGLSAKVHCTGEASVHAVLDAGAVVAGGSDWPVSPSPNAWEGIHGLVTRQDPSGQYPGTLWPEQAITLEEAIAAFTLGGATAMGLGDETGSIAVGKSADFVVLDRDPFAHPADELARTEVVETWFAGRQVYARD